MPFLEFLIPAAATLIGSIIGGKSTKDAANTQAAATGEANALQQYMYDTTRSDWGPQRQAGYDALAQIAPILKQYQSSLQNYPQSVTSEPGYEFGFNEGMRGVAQMGGRQYGTSAGSPTAKDAFDWGGRYGTIGAERAFNRLNTGYTNQLNPLMLLAGFGNTANQQTGQAGQNYANQAGAGMIGAGNAIGAGQYERGNIYADAINQLGAIGGRYARQPSPSGGGSYTPAYPWQGLGYDPYAPVDTPFW